MNAYTVELPSNPQQKHRKAVGDAYNDAFAAAAAAMTIIMKTCQKRTCRQTMCVYFCCYYACIPSYTRTNIPSEIHMQYCNRYKLGEVASITEQQ